MVASDPQAAGVFERHCAKDILHDPLQRLHLLLAVVCTLDSVRGLLVRQIRALAEVTSKILDCMQVDGAAPRKVMSGEYDSPQFADGRLLYGRARSLYAQDFSLTSFQVSGKPIKIADDVNTYHGRASASFSVSNSGLLAYRTSPVRFTELVWLDRSGRVDVSFPATEKGWGGTFDLARDSSKALFCESDQSASIPARHGCWTSVRRHSPSSLWSC
jgi:hypothetical protein